MRAYNRLFEPIRIGTMEVKNRFVMAPMVTNYCEQDGSVTDRLVAYHRARARGGGWPDHHGGHLRASKRQGISP